MDATERHLISLTGPNSHTLVLRPGVGAVTIGPEPDADLVVDPGSAIDWTAFDPLTTPAGSPWPRWLHYHGDDADFFDWARTRPIEGITWRPEQGHEIDATASQIGRLGVQVPDAPLRIALPADQRLDLSLHGHLHRLVGTGAPPGPATPPPPFGGARPGGAGGGGGAPPPPPIPPRRRYCCHRSPAWPASPG